MVWLEKLDDMTKLVTRYRSDVPVPLMIDSTEAPVLQRSLQLAGGRSIINPINLEDGRERIERLGSAAAEAEWPAHIDSRKPQDLAILLYTSGTPGRPKGAMLSHHNVLYSVRGFNLIIAQDETDEHMCFCLLYTSDAADERSSVDLGGRRIIKKKKNIKDTYANNDELTRTSNKNISKK